MKSSFVISLAVCLFVRLWDCASAMLYTRELHKHCSKNLSLGPNDVVELYIDSEQLPDVADCKLIFNIGRFRRKLTIDFVSVDAKQEKRYGNCYPNFKLQYDYVCLRPSLVGLTQSPIARYSYSVTVRKTDSFGYIKAHLRISVEPVVTFTTSTTWTITLVETDFDLDIGFIVGLSVGLFVLVTVFICVAVWYSRRNPQGLVDRRLWRANMEAMLASERLGVVINPSPNTPYYPGQHPTQQPSPYPGQHTEPLGQQYPSRAHVPAHPPSGSSSEPVDQSGFGPPPSYKSCIESEHQPLKPSAPPPQEF